MRTRRLVGLLIWVSISLAIIVWASVGLADSLPRLIESQKAVQQAEKEHTQAVKDVAVARENLETILAVQENQKRMSE
jgi:membrane-anchored glycerophosphoryl diester phosphodiesterase (GDPDase)